jgi:hypothetical protein
VSSLDSSNVWVDEDGCNTSFFQSFQSLGTYAILVLAIVELVKCVYNGLAYVEFVYCYDTLLKPRNKAQHTRVIEFSSLSNAQTTAANDQDLLYIDWILCALNYTTF